MRVHAALVTLVGVVLSASGATAQDARSAVAQFASRLSAIAVMDMIVTQSLTLYDPKDFRRQVTGQQRLSIKLPARQRIETEVAGRREVQVLNGDRLVVERGGKVFEAPPAERARHRAHLLFPFRRTAADILVEWRDLGVRTDVSRTVRMGNRTVTVIGARTSDRSSPSVWLDPDYGVVRFVTRQDGAGGLRVLDLTFSEHRKVLGGFFYPYRQEIFVDGKLLSVAHVRTVEVNTGLPDSFFDPDTLLKRSSR